MADPFVAEIRMFCFNFAPTGWAFCDGQLLPLSQNTALFSLLGTTYGGDGRSTFALPNLQGSVAVHQGQGPGLQLWDLGQVEGVDNVTLLQTEMPNHNHGLNARVAAGSTPAVTNNLPSNASWVQGAQFGVVQAYATNAPDTAMNPQAIASAGGNLPHNNMMPYLTISFCIALQGVFPPRP
ncbi:phage tail protein [Novosphingobium album (ex Liu et al. 2023)]|uniref:Tail fiber protein n=1 Tax=Novosphingobium album (ex Liu et al. 2023) TaxID=3031130 RepID=A0ABT5WMP4_9SPHN|nr:tail fiber protein [Novosphingobium album (ex Liu et al. 2023)]MDE8651301.1 tail fiber protein [Novosphingobium album (ex Liu et al. 2023)]